MGVVYVLMTVFSHAYYGRTEQIGMKYLRYYLYKFVSIFLLGASCEFRLGAVYRV